MATADLSTLETELAAAEAAVGGVRPGCEKRVQWTKRGPEKAPLAVLYVHGFSATGREISPVPEDVASALDAPLYVPRLTGHGQNGEALAAASNAAWRRDLDEALGIVARMGERVLIIACSTGCTLVTTALAEGRIEADVAGVVFVSPNYGLRNRMAQSLLDAPGSRVWGPLVVRNTVSFPTRSDAHAAYWTTSYPARAVFAVDDAVREACRADLRHVATPAMFAYCDDDQVVNPAKTRTIMGQWAGPVTRRPMVMRQGDDPMGHLVAGEVHSAGQTAPLVQDILAWARALPQGASGGGDGPKKPGAVR